MYEWKKFVGVLLIVVLGVAPSCDDDVASDNGSGGDAGADGDADGDGDSDADSDEQINNACAEDEGVGSFRISLTENATSVSGAVFDGVTPSHVPVELDVDGACVLQGPRDLACNPQCTGEETCGFDETCIPTPLKHSVGTVTVDGMNTPVTMEPSGFDSGYTATIRDSNPALDSGAAITLTASGGEYSPFSLEATGVSLIASDMAAVAVDRDTPVDIAWIPDDEAGDYVEIRLVVNAHGATSGWIVCEVPDTGTHTIPAPLVTTLIDLGLSGWPLLELSRRSDASTSIEPGCVDLLIFSSVSLSVEIPGLVSCSEDEDCPDGQVCLADLSCG